MRSTVLVALAVLLASSVPILEAAPPRSIQDSGQSFNSRHLSWLWNNDEEQAETFSTNTSFPFPTPSLSPTTTKKPGRFLSWLSRTGSKFKNIASKVANGTGEVLTTGVKKVGDVVKSGYNKIKSKFSGAKEKFKVFKNYLKEKVEAGDKRTTELMQKIGINVYFSDDKIVGATAQRKNISVSEVLQREDLFSKESSHFNRNDIEPKISREIGVGLEAASDYYEPQAHTTRREVLTTIDSFHYYDEYPYNENRPSTGLTTPATEMTNSTSNYTTEPQGISTSSNSVSDTASRTSTFSPSVISETANTTDFDKTMFITNTNTTDAPEDYEGSGFPGIPDIFEEYGTYEPSQFPDDVFADPDVANILSQLFGHFSTMEPNLDSSYDHYYIACGCYH